MYKVDDRNLFFVHSAAGYNVHSLFGSMSKAFSGLFFLFQTYEDVSFFCFVHSVTGYNVHSLFGSLSIAYFGMYKVFVAEF
jgi:hypothetical protein